MQLSGKGEGCLDYDFFGITASVGRFDFVFLKWYNSFDIMILFHD